MDGFEQALAQAQEWLGRDGVVAVGEGEARGERVIDVWVLPDADLELPASVGGVRVRMRVSGEPRAL